MAKTDNSSNTYVNGIISDLEECSTIVLYRSTRLLSISIQNMEYVLETLEKNKNYNKINKVDNYYLFDRLDENNNIRYTGFDTIIYINHLGIPIGYTKFNTIKGLIPEKLKITTDFLSNSNVWSDVSEENIDIEFSLNNITEYISLTRKLLIDEPYGFTTAKDIRDGLTQINLYNRYTNNTDELITNPEKAIRLNYGLLNNEGFYRLNLVTNMVIPQDFYNIQFGYYKGEVVCYLWRINNESELKLDYKIISLSRKDVFGNPIQYTNRDSFNTLNVGKRIEKVNYFSGRYVSIKIKDQTDSEVWNIIENSKVILDNDYKNHVINLWGTGQIMELPNVLSKKNITEFIPEVRNLFINIKNYRQSIHLVKTIGEWFVFRETRTNVSKINNISKSFLVYTNMTKTVMVSETLDHEPIPINDNILLMRVTETLDNVEYDYYNYYVGSGNFISENALMELDIIQKGTKNNRTYNSELGYIQYSDANIDNYSNNLIRVDNLGSNILTSYLSGFRKYTCPDDLKVPEIIGAINGLVYYKSGNDLRLL